MMRRDRIGNSHRGLTRRSLLQSAATMMSVRMFAESTMAWAQEKVAGTGEVVFGSFGGSFSEGVRKYVFEPFTKATGIKVIDATVASVDPVIMQMHHAGRMDWDIAYIASQLYPQMHEVGILAPINYGLWDDESIVAVPAHLRFSDAVVGFGTGVVLAYDTRAFPNEGPRDWADFWDVKKFPGPRGLISYEGKYNIVTALVADGVLVKDVFPLTDDKLNRAFKKLSEIKPHITKWWSAGGEAPQLLVNREYVMTSTYDGRAISAIRQGAPIKFVWDGAFYLYTYAAILARGPNTENAQKLMAFLNRAQNAAAFTLGSGYASPNTKMLKYLPGDLVPLLAVTPENASKPVYMDAAWMSAKRSDGKTNAECVQDRWVAWRSAA